MIMGSSFLNVFARSPIKPLQRHMRLVLDCIDKLPQFITAVLQENWENATTIQNDIVMMEAKADDVKREIRLRVPDSMLMPITRGEFLRLLTAQDKIASKAKHISGLIICRRMQIPQVIASKYSDLVQYCIDVVVLASKVIDEFDELIETGFSGSEVEIVKNMILELDIAERNTDEAQMQLRQLIFDIEAQLDPIQAIFVYKLVDWTGELADQAQHVGYMLETLLAR